MSHKLDPRIQRLREKIASFPKTPGVYLMRDAHATVLYVGKGAICARAWPVTFRMRPISSTPVVRRSPT